MEKELLAKLNKVARETGKTHAALKQEMHDALFGLAPLPNEEKARRLEYQRSAEPAAASEKSEAAPASADAPASDAPKLKMVGK